MDIENTSGAGEAAPAESASSAADSSQAPAAPAAPAASPTDNPTSTGLDALRASIAQKAEQQVATPEKAAANVPVAGAPAAGAAVVPGAAAAAQPYTMNPKFKAYGKEYEFDDWAKGLVKDKETEDKMRTLYAKAYGLDGHKEVHEQYKQEVAPKLQEFSNVQRGLKTISHFVQTKDYDNFFASLNIPEQDIYDWFERKVEELKQPPHIQAQLKQSRTQSMQQLVAQQQNEFQQEQQKQFMAEAQDREFAMFQSLPEVAQTQSVYDDKMGDGAYKKLIQDRIEIGRMKGENLTLADAIQKVNATVKQFMGLNPQAQTVPQQQFQSTPQQNQAAAPVSKEPGKPPVLPNISGKGTSPVKVGFKDLESMRNKARELDRSGE